jgi:hypothetical protein
MNAYWQAAMRLRDNEPLYPPVADLNAHDVYRYAPWFAALWVPLTLLPKTLVTIAWVALMAACTAFVLKPLVTRGAAGWVLTLVLLPMMAQSAWYGQVQPLLVTAIILSLDRTAMGPAIIGMAASMKAAPILFALVFIARRQWLRAAGAVAIALGLALPTFAFDLTHYPFDAGPTVSLWTLHPGWWLAGALSAILTAIWLAARRSQWTVLAAGTATIMAGPRLYVDLISYLMPAVHHGRNGRRSD